MGYLEGILHPVSVVRSDEGAFSTMVFYGIVTMMSMAVLAVMTTISIDLLFAVSGALWASDLLPGMTKSNESMMSLAMQQGGLGMILTALILTAPPMAGAFFNGVMGQFHGSNQMPGSSSNNSAYPPGHPGYVPPQAPPANTGSQRTDIERDRPSR